MNILAEIQKIPGLLIFSHKETAGFNVLECHFNWVLKHDFGLIKIEDSLFKSVKWEFSGQEHKSSFMLNDLKIPVVMTTKITGGHITDDIKFSIPFNLEMPLDACPEDMGEIKKIVGSFNQIKNHVEESLKKISMPFS